MLNVHFILQSDIEMHFQNVNCIADLIWM